MPSPIGDLWHFNLHQLDDFLARMALPGYVTIYRMMADLEGKPEGQEAHRQARCVLLRQLGAAAAGGAAPKPGPDYDR